MISLGPFENEDQLLNACIAHVRRHGFAVTEDRAGFEPVAELRERIGIRLPSYFTKLLHHPECPHFLSVRGASGRFLKIKCNPHLDAWLRAHVDNQRA
jgi:hypothetical protein